MYYVIQVTTGQEERTLEHIWKYINKKTFQDLFIPIRKREKKVNGKWTLIEEKWFPGYLFVETNSPRVFAAELNKLEGFKRLSGYRNERLGIITYIPLSDCEEAYINKLLRRDMKKKSKTVDISKVTIQEGKHVKVIDGPLFGLDATLIKYDLHKRVAKIKFKMFDKTIETQVGIDILIEKDNPNYLIN